MRYLKTLCRFSVTNTIACSLFVASVTNARTRSLLVAGDADQVEMVLTLERAFNYGTDNGHDPVALVGHGENKTWIREPIRDLAYVALVANRQVQVNIPAKSLGAATTSNIKAQIQSIGRRLHAGDTLILYLDDHGGPPKANRPETAFLVTAKSAEPALPKSPLSLEASQATEENTDGKLTHGELRQSLNEYIPKDVAIRVISDNCFDGHLHEFAFERPDLCSGTASDFASTSAGGYGDALWRHIEPGDSLFFAHWTAALASVQRHQGRSSLSSQTFMDKVLKTGAYDPQNREPFFTWHEFTSADWTTALFKYVFGRPTNAPLKEAPLNPFVCEDLENQDHALSWVETQARSLRDLLLRSQASTLSRQLPEALHSFCESSIAILERSNGASHRDELHMLKGKQEKLKSTFQTALLREPNGIGGLLKKYEDLESEKWTLQNNILGSTLPILYCQKAIQFFEKASPDEIKKFKELIECELKPVF